MKFTADVKDSKAYLLLSIIILLWGSNFVVSRLLSGIEPVRVSGIYYALFRYLFGALTMVGVLGVKRKGLKTIREEIRPYKGMLALSAFLSAVFVIAIHTSTEYVSSGTTSIIVNLSPIVVLVFGALFLREGLTPLKVFGFVMGALGGVLFLFQTLSFQPNLALGLILATIGMFAWGGYTVVLHYLEGADPYIVMTVKHAASTLMIVPFIFLFLIQGAQLTFILDAVSILGLLFAGVLASGLAYVLYFTAIEVLGAAKASSFLFLIPFVSVAGDFVLGEPPELFVLLAGAIALIGVALIRLEDSRKQEESCPYQKND